MSLQTTTNQLEKWHECQSNISTFFCKECKRNLFKQCWEIIHNMTTSHNINKSHSSPSQLVIPIKDILSIFLFNKVTKHDGQFRNGFLIQMILQKFFHSQMVVIQKSYAIKLTWTTLDL